MTTEDSVDYGNKDIASDILRFFFDYDQELIWVYTQTKRPLVYSEILTRRRNSGKITKAD